MEQSKPSYAGLPSFVKHSQMPYPRELTVPTSPALTIPASLITLDTNKFANNATIVDHAMDTLDSATVNFLRRESPVASTIA